MIKHRGGLVCDTQRSLLGLSAEEAAPDGAQKGIAPDPDRQQRTEDHDCIDALAALPLPVDVLEIEPNGELIECQSSCDSVSE